MAATERYDVCERLERKADVLLLSMINESAEELSYSANFLSSLLFVTVHEPIFSTK